MWALLIFLTLVTVRPSGLPSCPSGSFYNPVTKTCQASMGDIGIDREPLQPITEPPLNGCTKCDN